MKIKHSIKEQVYEILKEKILTQEYMPGEKIIIDNVARELQVSNSPIREAISRLENEGLIQYEPNQGPKVINMTSEEVNQISETISIMLIGGYKLSLKKKKTPLIVERMETILEKQKKLLVEENYYELNKTAVEFDMCLVEFCENPRLINVLHNLTSLLLLTTISLRTKDIDSFTKSLTEHLEIINAVKSNNFDLVEQAILNHYHPRNFKF